MTKPAALKLLFNATGILIGLIVVGYVVFSGFLPESETSCRERYPSTTRLSLRSAQGEPLTPIELQARAGFASWGVKDNASVVREGADGTALQVKLATLSDVDAAARRTTNGVHFLWQLAAMAKATSACLSYSVWLPKDFSFENGGVLPGLVGGVPGEIGNANRFATLARWQDDGKIGLDAALPDSGFRPVERAFVPLPAGRWTRIDQEITLNAPGKPDGSVHMWIDGHRAGDKERLVLRKDEAARFIGVGVDVGYLRNPKKVGELRLTPFELSWR